MQLGRKWAEEESLDGREERGVVCDEESELEGEERGVLFVYGAIRRSVGLEEVLLESSDTQRLLETVNASRIMDLGKSTFRVGLSMSGEDRVRACGEARAIMRGMKDRRKDEERRRHLVAHFIYPSSFI